MLTVQDHMARFFYTMSAHQYITPLNSIISASHLLKEEAKSGWPPDYLDLLDMISTSGHKLFRISKKMQWFFTLRFQERSPWTDQPRVTVKVGETLHAIRETLELGQSPRFGWEINVSPELTFQCNARLNEFMMGELLENAFRHGDEKSPILVTAAGDRDFLYLAVGNEYESPVPFTDEQIEPFCNVQVSPQGVVSGSGLGLFLLKDWVESVGGSLLVRGEDHIFETRLKIPLTQNAF
jgi:two-component system, sensor histidine kinase and response regulator